jgi:hypothetical protein
MATFFLEDRIGRPAGKNGDWSKDQYKIIKTILDEEPEFFNLVFELNTPTSLTVYHVDTKTFGNLPFIGEEKFSYVKSYFSNKKNLNLQFVLRGSSHSVTIDLPFHKACDLLDGFIAGVDDAFASKEAKLVTSKLKEHTVVEEHPLLGTW